AYYACEQGASGVDMGRNMTFDDVSFYRRLCHEASGPVLELGCGNGRILLPLLQDGIDAIGVDASAGMLAAMQRTAQSRGLPMRAARMDIRALGLRAGFGVTLCPYSLITYVREDRDVAVLLAALFALLRPGGRCVIDAFVPRRPAVASEFALDYRRPFEAGVLARWKRITAVSATVNRIERRYVVEDAAGHTINIVDVVEDIRPRSHGELQEHLRTAGFALPDIWWDYGASAECTTAQFATLVARRPPR
ncbi:MAG: class I SAM-dependent methyltransferase, partial [Betaproteobacteria bacterium]